ncbi:uncharacterized protein LOC123503509 [Portunus trituberculatus]|uniref:uncharacterized protein LOC123503509 n=1 Tax=Portunus trituberculatus TaxID=210409 RepID=UPI001E1CB3A5|nr:uncharacterized protein LOC123503509 [Portunus trituberculatus]
MRRRGVRTSRTWCTTLWAPSTVSGSPHDLLLNFPIKKPFNTVPPPPPLASPTRHPPPPPSPQRSRLQESRGERILRSAHAQQQDSTRMCRCSRWLTALRRTLRHRPAPRHAHLGLQRPMQGVPEFLPAAHIQPQA